MNLNSSSTSSLLTGFLDLEAAHHWIFTPFFFVYISVLFGSDTHLLLIKEEHKCHEPVYYFLAMLAATNLGLTLSARPLSWESSGCTTRGLEICLSRAYFIYSVSFVESGVFLAMAYDHFWHSQAP